MSNPIPQNINPDIIKWAKENPALRQIVELYLQSELKPEGTIELSWQQALETAVVTLAKQVHELGELMKMFGANRRDVMLLKDALVNETDDVLKGIGGAFRLIRIKNKLRLEDIAAKRGSKSSVSVLSQVENGKSNFQISTLLDIANALDLEITITANQKDHTQKMQGV